MTRADNEDMTLSLLTWFFFSPVIFISPLPTNISQEQQTAFRLRKTFFKLLALPPYKKGEKDKPLALFNVEKPSRLAPFNEYYLPMIFPIAPIWPVSIIPPDGGHTHTEIVRRLMSLF